MGNNKLVDITGLSRYHENLKNVFNTKQDVIDDLDAIRSGAAAGADALDAAKEYADGLASNYDAAGAAAAAEAAAIADAAAKYQVKGDYEAAGALDSAKAYADELNAAMDERVVVLEGIDHDKIAADAAAAAVATVVDGAPEKFDTLKEVAQWIANSDSANSAADLVTRVTALEAIDHEAYVNADATVLAEAKTYVDGKVDGKFDAAGDAAQALADAKTYVDGKGYITANDLTFAADSDIDALFA